MSKTWKTLKHPLWSDDNRDEARNTQKSLEGSKYGRRTNDEDDFRRNKPKESFRSRNLDDDKEEKNE